MVLSRIVTIAPALTEIGKLKPMPMQPQLGPPPLGDGVVEGTVGGTNGVGTVLTTPDGPSVAVKVAVVVLPPPPQPPPQPAHGAAHESKQKASDVSSGPTVAKMAAGITPACEGIRGTTIDRPIGPPSCTAKRVTFDDHKRPPLMTLGAHRTDAPVAGSVADPLRS